MKNKNLLDMYPEIAAEWHPTKNGDKTPKDVSPGSNTKVWWYKISCGHSWDENPNNRTRNGFNCPYCSHRRVCLDNCLATLRPDVAKQWHATKNTITPNDVMAGSKIKAWWQCEKNQKHEWESTINTRTTHNTGCPYCSGNKVCEDNCLATLRPDIVAEWHPTKNGKLTPFDVSASSHTKVWWQCERNEKHEWEAVINTRVRRNSKTGCPCCSGRRACEDNCLATLRPDVAKEWHADRNTMTPNDVTVGSGAKVWWQCKQNPKHEWEATVASRALNNTGCSYCDGKKVCEDNCLATLCPDIAADWHPIKNGKLTPFDVTASSRTKVWWQCKSIYRHEWETGLAERTSSDNCHCPYCSGHRACEDNCLATLRPDVAQEWHPTKNGKLTPFDVTFGSGEIIWWQCNHNNKHEWKTKCATRTSGNTGCPMCRSKQQMKIYEIVKKLYPNNIIEYNYKHPDLRFSKTNRMMELDVFLPELKIAIEYQGEWHLDIGIILRRKEPDWCENTNKTNWARDEEKRERCKEHDIYLVEIDYTWDGSVEAVKRAIAGDFKPFRPQMEKTDDGTRIYFVAK